ncbi:D-mannose binding lectin [Variovorax sp. PBS-H4]|uniref:hypothetical protein n=1 Tax=Variovorax sp. PBS-H4 TaxID=434008 RepID=UPI001315E613|nr:hypothetical protein [Variovorax sp. PBS-H4]VTU41125.1 D-mannose binding lectin [Variovorax sp. PBS-H4]
MRALVLFSAFILLMTGFAHSANLYGDQVIYKGQLLSSEDGRYRLIMQDDGNLVYYRTSDWSARWWTSTQTTGGHLAVMQGDGNFVVYDASWRALWQTETSGRPGALIAAQNDGNLVIYQNGQAIWDIGADIPEPTKIGDTVGRAMETNMPYGFLGHIGFFDRFGIYEVLNDGKRTLLPTIHWRILKREHITGTGAPPLQPFLTTLSMGVTPIIAVHLHIAP